MTMAVALAVTDDAPYSYLFILSRHTCLMSPRTILRFEGGAVFATAIATYLVVGGPLWLLAVLALAPDLSMLGYLAGHRLGSRLYNLCHTYSIPLALGALGSWTGVSIVTWGALVWAAHIGADRAVGYGLKYPTGFGHTHLSSESTPVIPAVAESEGDHTSTAGEPR